MYYVYHTEVVKEKYRGIQKEAYKVQREFAELLDELTAAKLRLSLSV